MGEWRDVVTRNKTATAPSCQWAGRHAKSSEKASAPHAAPPVSILVASGYANRALQETTMPKMRPYVLRGLFCFTWRCCA